MLLMIYTNCIYTLKITQKLGLSGQIPEVSGPQHPEYPDAWPESLDKNWWHRISKTGGTDFGGDAQLGAQRLEQKKEGLGEVEGNAVMLTCRENGLSCHISI